MPHKKRLILTAILNVLLGVNTTTALADDKDKKIQLLEQRLQLLEKRLDSQQQAPAQPAALDSLDQKVKILERQNEIDKETAENAAKTAPKLDVSAKGVTFSSADGDHSVRLRASIQTDGRFFPGDNKDLKGAGQGLVTNRFELKQARIWLEGKFWKYNDFKIMPDFGLGRVTLADAYVDAHYFSYASFNFGKQKTPLSLERLQGDSDGTFLERAYPTYLSSNRDIGVKMHGSFASPSGKYEYAGPIDFKNFFTYEVGVFNGGGDNGASEADAVNNDGKEIAGRLWLHPFQDSGVEALEGLGIGVAGSRTISIKNATPVKNLTSALGQNTIVNYTNIGAGVGAAGVQADGEHYRIYPQAYWYYGPFGLLGEYVLSSQQLTGDGGKTHIQQNNTAWQVQASYVLTGENNTFQSVKPRSNFDPTNGNWGAFQVAARWSELAIDKDTFLKINNVQLLDPTKSVSGAQSWTVGANWFLNQNVRLMADYEHTYFNGGAAKGDRPSEKAFAARLQFVF